MFLLALPRLASILDRVLSGLGETGKIPIRFLLNVFSCQNFLLFFETTFSFRT
jgi:hypothetical protein